MLKQQLLPCSLTRIPKNPCCKLMPSVPLNNSLLPARPLKRTSVLAYRLFGLVSRCCSSATAGPGLFLVPSALHHTLTLGPWEYFCLHDNIYIPCAQSTLYYYFPNNQYHIKKAIAKVHQTPNLRIHKSTHFNYSLKHQINQHVLLRQLRTRLPWQDQHSE
jgi:hypothetical protein